MIGTKRAFVQKEKFSVLIRRLRILLYFFLLRNGILLDLKTKHIVSNYLCYVMQFINL